VLTLKWDQRFESSFLQRGVTSEPWMADYCGAYPNRLGGVILAGARDIEGALAEIRRWGQASWAWGMMVYAPVGMPLDHPALEPLYAEAAGLDPSLTFPRERGREARVARGWGLPSRCRYPTNRRSRSYRSKI
jgi:predicted TIM-barrel fold metal-dependent hydrolase